MDGNTYDSESDESLVLAYQRGDKYAFDEVYRRLKKPLFGFLYCSCPQRSVAEELAQDAWMSIIARIAKYQPTASFKTYLFRVAHNKLIDYRRHNKNAPRCDGFSDDLMLSDAPTQQRRVEILELLKAIDSLRPVLRDVMLLRLQDLSIDAIAEITGVEREAVKSRLRYAINHLRGSLGGADV